MKTSRYIIGIIILFILAMAVPSNVIGQGKGKGGPPPWAPANGYRAKTSHIYFPDQNFYFDIQKSVYIYMSGDKWQVSATIPSIYARIDFNSALKVELELNTDSPQQYNSDHVIKYKNKGIVVQNKPKAKPVNPGKGKKK